MAINENATATTATCERTAYAMSCEMLLDALPMPAYLCDGAGVIVACNTKALELWGSAVQVGRSDVALFPQTSAEIPGKPRSVDAMEVTLETAAGFPFRAIASVSELTDGESPAGVFLKCFQRFSPERNEDLLGLQRQNATLERRVAERTQAAEATSVDLHESERNFSLLVGSVVDYGIYMLDPRGMITNWNIGAERIKGYRADEVVGTHFSRFYTAEERDRGMPGTALATAERDGRYSAEGWRVRKDGSHFWASVVIDPIFDRGKLIGFAKVTRDITERMRAEAALIESEYLARGVIDAALDGFVQLDESGRVVQWNPRAEALFGWSRGEAMGQPLATLVAADEDHGRFEASLQPATTGIAQGYADQRTEMRSREGRRIPVELSISSLSLNGNRHTNLFIRDLREKVLIEAQLRQAQKMEAVGQLTGGLAHDFNNMLQGIIGSLDLIQLRLDAGRTDEIARFVSGALNSAYRAAAMTHRLLAFSRRQPLDPRPVLANPLLLSMADLLERTLGERIELVFELATDVWTTLCDPNQLESAVLNLSINARDAMPEGGQLRIRSWNEDIDDAGASRWSEGVGGQYICIEVADDGVGMNSQIIEHVFEPFFTTKPPGQGTGLGLSMVYGFTRQSNGYCDIVSEVGKGTAIRLYLPRFAVAADEPGAEETASVPASTGKGERVLVVEDEDVVRNIIVEVLHQLGYEALEAADAEAGLALFESHDDIRMLVSDIGLPGMNGRVLANMARESCPGLKVLLMTGYASDASAPGGFAMGMELLTKPFTVGALAERLRKMLG